MFWTKPKPAVVVPQKRFSFFSTHALDAGVQLRQVGDVINGLLAQAPRLASPGAQDDGVGAPTLKQYVTLGGVPEALTMWYASQGFIGYQLAAIISQHWLVNKCCSVPARDAVRKGYEIVSVDGDELAPDVLKVMNRYDRAMRLKWNLEQFVRMGRVFGVRVALFKVETTDPEYYEKPFNPDGVTPGSYKGIVQVDPYWTAPMLQGTDASQPDTKHFYEPTYWIINGQKYHRSHLIIYRHDEPADLLKPSYLYGGVPVPQQVMERVYAAERTANEAPQLAQTKRTDVWLTDMEAFTAGGDTAIQRMNDWASYRDNYAIKLGDKDGDEFQQYDTSLADLDAVIMTQYQIVAAAANIPVTKLLGTTPKGFNATGEYEEASYHEELESIQAHDLTPLIERHHLLVMRSFIPEMKGTETTVNWHPLDAPTAQELAATNLAKAQAGQVLIASGALSSEDERRRIAMDPQSGYQGIDLSAMPEPELEPDEEE